MTRRTHARSGTTLVELLVASSMSILVMWLLTWCYQQGLGSFTATKAQGDLMDQERQVTSLMTRDLTAPHFSPDDTKPNLGLRVSDQGYVGTSTSYVPPIGGYFRATTTPASIEATDSDGFNSWRSTGYSIQFTSVLPGGPPQNLFSAELTTPAMTYFGRAAEIAYFLNPTPTGTTPNGTPLYNLIRRQRVCAMTSDDAGSYNVANSAANTSDVMSVKTAGNPATKSVLTLAQLTTLGNRLTAAQLATTDVRYGEDILMSNVLSFEIKFTGAGTNQSNNTTWPTAFPGNSDFPYDDLPPPSTTTTTGVYDASNPTGKNATPSAKVRVTGAQIRLRAYSPRSQITRQTTFIVSL